MDRTKGKRGYYVQIGEWFATPEEAADGEHHEHTTDDFLYLTEAEYDVLKAMIKGLREFK